MCVCVYVYVCVTFACVCVCVNNVILVLLTDESYASGNVIG